MAACGHGPHDADFLEQWLGQVRTPNEPACPTCAGVFASNRTTHPFTLAYTPSCTQCGKSGAGYIEVVKAPSHRGRTFCDGRCQVAFHENGHAARGMPSRRAMVIGVLVPRPYNRLQSRRVTADDLAARHDFEHGTVNLLRAHEKARANHNGLQLPLFPSARHIIDAMEELHVRCAREAHNHYAFSEQVEAAAGSGATTTTVNPIFTRPQPMIDATDRLFLKSAQMKRLPDAVWKDFHLLVEMISALKQHQELAYINEDEIDQVMHLLGEYADVQVSSSARFNAFDNFGEDTIPTAFALLVDTLADIARKGHLPQENIEWIEFKFKKYFRMLGGGVDITDPLTKVKAWLDSTDHNRTIDLTTYDTKFSVDLNYENINDVVAGQRVTALVHAGISPAFTPVYDFFICNIEDGLPAVGTTAMYDAPDMGLFTISAQNSEMANDLVGLENIGEYNMLGARLGHLIEFTRSVLAQLLLALEAGQHHLRFVHYDLRLGNVMYMELPADYTGAHLQFRRPLSNKLQNDLFIRVDATDRRLVRIIDYGRTRVDHPNTPRSDTDVAHVSMEGLASQQFDQWVDMRTFAYDIGRFLFKTNGWLTPLANLYGLEGPQHAGAVTEMLNVVEEMIGMKYWTQYGKSRYRDFPDLITLKNSPAPFFDLLRSKMNDDMVSDSAAMKFWVTEVFGNRADQLVTAPTPSNILDMPFFDQLRTRPTSGSVDFIGDATQTVNRMGTT